MLPQKEAAFPRQPFQTSRSWLYCHELLTFNMLTESETWLLSFLQFVWERMIWPWGELSGKIVALCWHIPGYCRPAKCQIFCFYWGGHTCSWSSIHVSCSSLILILAYTAHTYTVCTIIKVVFLSINFIMDQGQSVQNVNEPKPECLRM